MKCEVFKYNSKRNHGCLFPRVSSSLFCSLLASRTWNALRFEVRSFNSEITTSNVTWNAVFFFVCVYVAVRAASFPATCVLEAVLYVVLFGFLFLNPVRYEFILQLPYFYFVLMSKANLSLFQVIRSSSPLFPPDLRHLLGGSAHSLSLTLLQCHQPPPLVFFVICGLSFVVQ